MSPEPILARDTCHTAGRHTDRRPRPPLVYRATPPLVNLMIGTLTPPIGIVLFVVARVADLPFGRLTDPERRGPLRLDRRARPGELR